MNYAAAVKAQAVVKPCATVVLEPSDFGDEWPDRPKTAVAIGMRRLSAFQEQGALEQVRRDIAERPEDAPALAPDELVETFNGALMVQLIGRALCDPNDASKPTDLFAAPTVQLPRALRRYTITRLWDTLEREVVGSSPVYREATDEEVSDLGKTFAAGADWAVGLPPAREARVRRFAAFILDEISE